MSLARTLVPRLLASVSLLALAACSANGTSNARPGGGGGTNGGGGTGGLLFGDGGTDNDAEFDEAGACAGETRKAELVPLDMYLMVDQSGSMSSPPSGGGGSSKWDAMISALTQFVSAPEAAGLGVGLQYFAIEDPNTFGGDSCDYTKYAKPEIEIDTLPNAAGKLTASLNNSTLHSPSTGTPTYAALKGAVTHAKQWAIAHPTHTTIVVLATDGEPSSVCSDVPNEDDTVVIGQQIAGPAAAGNPSVKTFVIGVLGSGQSLTNLNDIATPGGGGKAIMVGAGNATQEFLDAMNQIRGAALSCQYKVPTPAVGVVDTNKVNVKYTPGDGSPTETFKQVTDQGACNGGPGWYYDDPQNPQSLVMCPATCDELLNGPQGSQVDIQLGCSTLH